MKHIAAWIVGSSLVLVPMVVLVVGAQEHPQPPAPLAQGHSVFQFNTNEGQCQVRLGREAAARGRNVGVACPSQQSNRGIA
jgi:hypothetical protein